MSIIDLQCSQPSTNVQFGHSDFQVLYYLGMYSINRDEDRHLSSFSPESVQESLRWFGFGESELVLTKGTRAIFGNYVIT